MAQATVTKLIDGNSSFFHVFIEGDGSGELDDFVIIDLETSFDDPMPAKPTLTLESVWYDMIGFNAKLEFDYLTGDTPILAMSGGNGTKMDFCHFSGIRDRSAIDGKGKLKITTSGLDSGDFGSMIVRVRKH